ncbi:hypothetical protein GSY71_06385 [Pusillimonas sp. TS35]|nr:hypothetical protein [Pusillimonas sp. TS35]
MSAHTGWRLICRLFALGQPVRAQLLAPAERELVPALLQAIKPVVVDNSDVLCPYCGQHSAPVTANGQGGRQCYCPDCGPVDLSPEDFRAYALDDGWMLRNLRLALDIQSRDGVDQLSEGVWRLGNARSAPVVLARNLIQIWKAPDLLERIRVANQPVRLVTPAQRGVQGMPQGYGVQWLPLEERFALYGGGITAIGVESSTFLPEPVGSSDPTAPTHGPFSADFHWATVPEIQPEPIKLTKTQGAIFKALWSFQGQPQLGSQIMARAGSKSDKPGDVFKGARYGLARKVYQALVQIDGRDGLYRMPCAALSKVGI